MLARLSALLAFTAAAVTVAAKPIVIRDSPITLPIARRSNLTGVPSVLKQHQARAKALKARSQGKVKSSSLKQAALFDVHVTNQAVDYTVSVGVSTHPTFYNLIVNVGSSNTWVGASTAYIEISSSVDTAEKFEVIYGSGLVFGEEFTDTVTIGDLVIENQGVGVGEIAFGFYGVDGILGIGPVGLTQGTTSGGEAILTVLDNAFAQGSIVHIC
ncbi:acid protease [Lentinus tigrinus ALCF2SS1-7]|uniref:Acid protease n=1 Tax=Lentinus tigrinus ALCF2SS1-6 TaxID=1328759 RepID=A0A5C2RTL7_9APHY|nr:acid protease [Lentinus tigrinus ALCF2SS1-6]RPD70492.1 acid protease [Lentinus tigrinus ALCF2SS1-7]